MTTWMPVVATKIGIVVLLAVAAVAGPPELGQSRAWLQPLLFAIGAVNVLFTVPGAYWIRTVGVAASFAGLLVPASRGPVVLLFWLVWPPAFLVAWALSRSNVDEDGYIQGSEKGDVWSLARIRGATLIVAVAVATLAYKLIFHQRLQQTAALFVGIPALLAIVVVLFVSPRSATGVACKAVTVGLLVSLVFLGEGVLCIVMSAPIFYAVAVVVATVISAAQRRSDHSARTLYSSALVLTILVSSLEGIPGSFSFDRLESVTTTKIVHAPANDIQRAILARPRFDRIMPLELRIGFPRPTSVRIGDDAKRWIIRMRGGEMRVDGIEPRAGDLVLELEASQPGLVRWRALSDNSHMTHFLTWRSATVTWEAVGANTTRVRWTLQYDRGLDPAWYFGPWERYVARIAAGYLIDAVATP